MVGLTYLLSSILGLLLKQLFSRRLLMLVCNCSVGNQQKEIAGVLPGHSLCTAWSSCLLPPLSTNRRLFTPFEPNHHHHHLHLHQQLWPGLAASPSTHTLHHSLQPWPRIAHLGRFIHTLSVDIKKVLFHGSRGCHCCALLLVCRQLPLIK